MKGLIAEGALPEMLREVYVGRRSGRLHVSRGRERYSVMFVKGDIVHCESSLAQAHLGEIMLGLGMIDQAVLTRARTTVEKSGGRMGEVLLAMGAIGRGHLEDALAVQVKEHLRRVFAWVDGGCAFQEQDPPADTITLKLSTGEMILDAVRLARDPKAIRSGLGDLGRVVILSSDPLLRFQRITLTPADGFVLSRVDGISTAEQVLQLVPLPRDEAERSLFGLLCTGVVDYLPAEKATSTEERRAEILAAFEGLAERDHFQVLSVPRDASQAEVAAAYHGRARRFHPDAHHDPALGDLREALASIFERLGVAYETLRRPASRQEYVASLARASRTAPLAASAPPPPASPEEASGRAEQAMAMAEERAGDGRHWEAIGLLEGLVTVTTGVQRRRARLRLAELYAKNPRAGKSAEEQLVAVVAENPENVEARLRLARLFRDRKMNARAIAYLKQVLELQPKNRAARDMMAALGPPTGRLERMLRR